MLVYKYLDVDGAEKTIENKSVLLKCPTEYRDLFDSNFYLDDKERKKAFDLYVNYLIFEGLRSGTLKASTGYTKLLKKNALLMELIIKKTSTFKKQLDLSVAYVLALKLLNKKDKDIRVQFNLVVDGILTKIREAILISCFGSSYDSSYLWSEYAEGHKGICMEYDVDGDEYRKVQYKKEIPVFQFTKALEIYFGHQICNKEIDTNNKAFWFALDPIFTKLEKYKNEEEIRCVFSNKKRRKNIRELDGLMLLEMPLPKRIFIGCRTSDDLERIIRSAYPRVNVEKMKVFDSKKGKLLSSKE